MLLTLQIHSDAQYQRSSSDEGSDSLKDRLILGLAVAVVVAFAVGALAGSFTVKYLENHHRSAKVEDKQIVVPGEIFYI